MLLFLFSVVLFQFSAEDLILKDAGELKMYSIDDQIDCEIDCEKQLTKEDSRKWPRPIESNHEYLILVAFLMLALGICLKLCRRFCLKQDSLSEEFVENLRPANEQQHSAKSQSMTRSDQSNEYYTAL